MTSRKSERPKLPTRACPRCESRDVARSRVRGVVGQAARLILGVRPYRCLDCWHRFHGISERTLER